MVTIWLTQPKEITDFKQFLELTKGGKGAKDAKAKSTKRSTLFITQLCWSRKTRESPSSRSEEADISTLSKPTRTTLPRDWRPTSTATNSRRCSSRTELSRRPRNDVYYLNVQLFTQSQPFSRCVFVLFFLILYFNSNTISDALVSTLSESINSQL